MVENGQPGIRAVPYQAPPGAPWGIEVMSFARLRGLGPWRRRAAPQRPRFHVLAVVEAGAGHHRVDFVRRPLIAGSALWVRPGVVHQWDGVERVDGTLVLFRPDFLTPGTQAQMIADDPFAPARAWRPLAGRAATALAHLREEYAAGPPDPAAVRAEVLRGLLSVLVLRFFPPGDPVRERGGGEVFTRFRAAVERDFARCREVARYGRVLGYAPRTLSRATRAAVGLGAKDFVDDRVVLEAKRLLAHGGLPASEVARALGFPDASNFAAFFRRRVGVAPGSFRARAGSGEDGPPGGAPA